MMFRWRIVPSVAMVFFGFCLTLLVVFELVHAVFPMLDKVTAERYVATATCFVMTSIVWLLAPVLAFVSGYLFFHKSYSISLQLFFVGIPICYFLGMVFMGGF